MPNERTIFLTDREARLAVKGELRAVMRVMKPQPDLSVLKNPDGLVEMRPYHRTTDKGKAISDFGLFIKDASRGSVPIYGYISPFGQPGDIVAAKESWMEGPFLSGSPLLYKADTNPSFLVGYRQWLSPILMPKTAIRHRFTVLSVQAMLASEITSSKMRGLQIDCPEHDFPGGFCVSECAALRKAFYEAYHITDPAKTWVWLVTLEVLHV
jgi:hypothetical protein